MVAATSREAVARQLMERPSYIPRWRDFLMDEVRVNRVGDKAQYDCYGDMLDSGDGGALAKHIRDSSPDVDYPGGTTTMSEVLVSSLELDDLSPFYRAHLFAMMSKPITGANVAALEMDITRRQDFGEIFSAVYTHRNVVCAGCHNSEWGVTDSNDPEEDKHWALPGLFEKAIYGTSVGRDEMEVYSAFRHLNVVENNGERPWGMSGNCGRFRAKENIPVDPADVDAYFVSALGKTASIWDVENALHQGCDMLREDGLQVDPETQEVDANEGLAYLLASRVANQVWQEAYGSPLTLVHYIPRNKEQRDILLDLTTVYIENGFSLRSLLVEVVTHPLFNQLDPASGCDPNTAYILPPVMNPWVLSEPDPSMQLNSVGDGVHRKPARLMLRSLSYAMDWPSAAAYPGGNDEEFQKAIGVFVKDAEPGFLGVDFQGMLSWESRYGACANQDNGIDWILHLLDGMGDFQIATQGTASARQVIIALKDRLLTQPSLEEGEAEFLAAFLGIESLDADAVTIPELQNSLRQLCGVLVESPQFLLAGSTQNMDTWLPPDIVVKGVSFKSMCEEAAETMFAKGWVLTCGDTELTLEEE